MRGTGRPGAGGRRQRGHAGVCEQAIARAVRRGDGGRWRGSAGTGIRPNPPDLVLSDIMMPGLDGFGLLAALRGRAETAAIPVILLSARAGEESSVEGLNAGATDYLVKPFTGRELLARIGAHMELVRIRKEAAAREAELRGRAEAARDEAAGILESITDAFATFDQELAVCLREPADRTNRRNAEGRPAGQEPLGDISRDAGHDCGTGVPAGGARAGAGGIRIFSRGAGSGGSRSRATRPRKAAFRFTTGTPPSGSWRRRHFANRRRCAK